MWEPVIKITMVTHAHSPQGYCWIPNDYWCIFHSSFIVLAASLAQQMALVCMEWRVSWCPTPGLHSSNCFPWIKTATAQICTGKGLHHHSCQETTFTPMVSHLFLVLSFSFLHLHVAICCVVPSDDFVICFWAEPKKTLALPNANPLLVPVSDGYMLTST